MEDIQLGIVTTKGLLDAVQRFRYQVYVEECGFERAPDPARPVEFDDWDPKSIHIAALTGAGDVIGNIRLILDSAAGLPTLRTMAPFYERPPAVTSAAEVSRLAISRPLRQGLAEGEIQANPAKPNSYIFYKSQDTLPSQLRRTRFAIIFGLFRLVYQTSIRLGISDWYFLADRPLWYFLRRCEILTNGIGTEMDFHGRRTPYVVNCRAAEAHLERANLALTKNIRTALNQPLPALATPAGLDTEPLASPVANLDYSQLLGSGAERVAAYSTGLTLGEALWPQAG